MILIDSDLNNINKKAIWLPAFNKKHNLYIENNIFSNNLMLDFANNNYIVNNLTENSSINFKSDNIINVKPNNQDIIIQNSYYIAFVSNNLAKNLNISTIFTVKLDKINWLKNYN